MKRVIVTNIALLFLALLAEAYVQSSVATLIDLWQTSDGIKIVLYDYGLFNVSVRGDSKQIDFANYSGYVLLVGLIVNVFFLLKEKSK
ncbi:MAG: hypothetical protein WCC10_13580 [Tumebacillaceae bacterium]